MKSYFCDATVKCLNLYYLVLEQEWRVINSSFRNGWKIIGNGNSIETSYRTFARML